MGFLQHQERYKRDVLRHMIPGKLLGNRCRLAGDRLQKVVSYNSKESGSGSHERSVPNEEDYDCSDSVSDDIQCSCNGGIS